jgi:hypothetical protein
MLPFAKVASDNANPALFVDGFVNVHGQHKCPSWRVIIMVRLAHSVQFYIDFLTYAHHGLILASSEDGLAPNHSGKNDSGDSHNEIQRGTLLYRGILFP